tara:strand:+ start:1606 stop:3786 length:2181 start_codon:yes stop_codon:yes gene_type:complete
MKPQRFKRFVPCKGISQVLMPDIGDANTVNNCRYVSEGGWKANVGFESWWHAPASWTVTSAIVQKYFTDKVDAVYQWKRQGTNDIYTFIEQSGRLYYAIGNKGQGATYTGTFYENDLVTIDSDRYIPKLGDVGSQFVNLGQHLLIINGRDRAILFSGDQVYRDFGFVLQTPSCDPLDVATEYQNNQVLSGGAAVAYNKVSQYGLGDVTENVQYTYNYKMTMISDLGAESPLSAAQSVSWSIPNAQNKRYGVALDLPIGQDGVVARRIYRTKEIATNGELYYFVSQLDENSSRFYIDAMPDRFLVDQAPSFIASTPITTDWKFGEVWDNRLWLAAGSRIIYSDKGIFEQFGALAYFDLGNQTGGDITQLVAFYNNLIVFRETAINIISFDTDSYNISTITNTLGTVASKAVVVIPQLGVVFINEQGVWMLSGGLNGGASISMQKISKPIDKLLRRVNRSMMHKAIAAYSYREKEVWMHLPTDDSTTPDFGFVLHLTPQNPMWSIRTDLETPSNSYWSAMTTTVNGYFLLGNDPNWTPALDATTKKFGPLQVMSSSSTWGQGCQISAYGDNVTFAITDTAHNGHQWESAWYNSNENSVKVRYFSVELRIMSYGDNGFDFFYGIDYSYTESTTSTQKQAKSETVYTIKEDAVFGPADLSVTKVPFTVNSSKIAEGRLITLRYDVNTELCDQFKFGVRTTNSQQWHLLSFNILSDSVAMPALNQSTKVSR